MDSANEYGILLEVIQVMIDLNLVIGKAYITSDGGWFMDGELPLCTAQRHSLIAPVFCCPTFVPNQTQTW